MCLILACQDQPLPTESTSAVLPASAPESTTVTRIELGTLGGRASYALAVNNDGVVAGWSYLPPWDNASHAIRWTADSGMIDLGTLPGDSWSRGFAINDAGYILGSSGRGFDINGIPAIWAPDGSVTAVPVGPWRHDPLAISPRGEIVGRDFPPEGGQYLFYWSPTSGEQRIMGPDGAITGQPTAIAASGMVVGTYTSHSCEGLASCTRAFTWDTKEGLQDIGFPGDDPAVRVTADAVSNNGAITGSASKANQQGVLYRWTKSTGFTFLPASEPRGGALGINEQGTVVGWANNPEPFHSMAAAWPRNGTRIDLGRDAIARGINNAGVVVGEMSYGDSRFRATIWYLGGPGSASPIAATDPDR